MSNRYRLPYVAFGGFLAVFLGVGLALAQEPSPETPQAVERSQGVSAESPAPKEPAPKQPGKAEQAAPAPPPARTFKEQRGTDESCDARCQATEQRQKNDLVAQQSMADASASMTSSAWFQVGIGGGALILLGFTVYFTWRAAQYTKRMLKQAEKTTKAAQAAIKATDKTAERQLRAYVFLESSVLEQHQPRNEWKIGTKFKNFGQTPAYNMTLTVERSIVDISKEHPFEPPELEPHGTESDLGPGQDLVVSSELPDLVGDTWGAYRARQKAIFLWGRIDFTDAFGEKRWVKFRLYQVSGTNLNLGYCEEGNKTSESNKST